jgi:quaternary ammonium compound-resistance protein SugE
LRKILKFFLETLDSRTSTLFVLCLLRQESVNLALPVTFALRARRGLASMNWTLLIIAGLLEVVWAIGLKYTEGFTRLWPSVGTAAAMLASVGLLGIAMRSLPVGTAYAVWVGVGAVGTVVLGIVLFGESASAPRLLSTGLIVAGIIGLKLAGE